jgi:hypothetical protein
MNLEHISPDPKLVLSNLEKRRKKKRRSGKKQNGGSDSSKNLTSASERSVGIILRLRALLNGQLQFDVQTLHVVLDETSFGQRTKTAEGNLFQICRCLSCKHSSREDSVARLFGYREGGHHSLLWYLPVRAGALIIVRS